MGCMETEHSSKGGLIAGCMGGGVLEKVLDVDIPVQLFSSVIGLLH